MKNPIILAVDDDPQVIRAVSRDLRKRYRDEYRIVATDSAREALESLQEMKNQGLEVALFVSDQRMPEMLGVDFLEKAKKLYPKAKRVLLTAYSDTDAAIQAINEVQLDYYLMKPWDPPEEKMYPVLDDHLEEWQSQYIPEFSGIRVIGYQFSPKSHRLKDFLAGNLFPYRWYDVETAEQARELMTSNKLEEKNLPVIFFEDGSFIENPDIPEVASRLGLNPRASADMYDVIIIGAGPAGLAAAVYGASEGLKTLLVERRAPGGQAGTSSRIENYLGFPKGLSGSDLARRAITQATRLGTEVLTPSEVIEIKLKDQYKIVVLKDGSELTTKSIVITTGVDYRKLDTAGVDNFTGAGIYYGAATTEANACKDQDVYVVGGGNSAGQAAMYLSQFARRVFILIRREDLTSTMSAYLIDQINGTENIEVMPHSEVIEAHGSDRLECLTIKTGDQSWKVGAAALFVFIGARPYTDWMNGLSRQDEKGFLLTGRDLALDKEFKKNWKLQREPFLLETSTPGIFAAGDVRSGAMNRVASAVGEGAMSISFVHRYLEEV
ncbi:MAG: fused response regulator/thioredoxin-disulfide reductase [Owenweeksia sp.]|nr:fused response regulator/thioredoxin-disulfide reductase [Owenweeksia sp.]MBF97534.1 fused response regulator/thioredoxin-disulfide reductase [Owenweeksia sp.]